MKVKKDTCIILAITRETATLLPDIRHTPQGWLWSWSRWRTRPVVTSTSLTDWLALSTATIRSSDTRHMSLIQHSSLSWSVLTTMSFPWENFALAKSMSTMKIILWKQNKWHWCKSFKLTYMYNTLFSAVQNCNNNKNTTHNALLSATLSVVLCTNVENGFGEIR